MSAAARRARRLARVAAVRMGHDFNRFKRSVDGRVYWAECRRCDVHCMVEVAADDWLFQRSGPDDCLWIRLNGRPLP